MTGGPVRQLSLAEPSDSISAEASSPAPKSSFLETYRNPADRQRIDQLEQQIASLQIDLKASKRLRDVRAS